MIQPTFFDILDAKRLINRYLAPTPLYNYPALDRLLDAHVFVKHENYQPIGAFKVRGGINLIARLSEDERNRGVATASTGNHGQSIAYATNIFGVEAVIYAPQGVNPVKMEAMQSHGARVVLHGADFDDSRTECEAMAQREGMRFISSGDEPFLISGVGTITLELLEQQPDVETILVPIGGGSGASGACLAAKTINPNIQVIGVQAAAAPSAYLTWLNKEYTPSQMKTDAEGLATRTPFMLPQEILWKHLDDFLLLEEREMRQAVRLYLEKAKTLAELAGAAPLAAALKVKERIQGKKIALILSGGNINPEKLQLCLKS